MRIAVASGKGGTGKTTIATSLAASLEYAGRDVHYVDCDVEAPNGHLFLKPLFQTHKPAVVYIPHINFEKCSSCGKCVRVCEFHALAQVGKNILVFSQLCHGCGSCAWNCPEKAITEVPNSIGVLEAGTASHGLRFSRGVLTISEPMPTPIIRQLKRLLPKNERDIVILDSPPGASCSVVESVRGSDYILLVTEPTPFGLHDLRQMVGITRDMQIPAGVIINRDQGASSSLIEYCRKNNLEVLMNIPFSRRFAEGISRGELLIDIDQNLEQEFVSLFLKLERLVKPAPAPKRTRGEKR